LHALPTVVLGLYVFLVRLCVSFLGVLCGKNLCGFARNISFMRVKNKSSNRQFPPKTAIYESGRGLQNEIIF